MAQMAGTQSITAGTFTATVSGTFAASYQVASIVPSWITAYAVTSKTASSFTVIFESAPVAAGTFDWSVVSQLAGAVTTSLQICNNALLLIGDQTITSLSQDVPRATILNALYTPTLDEVLRSHNWNFATVRAGMNCGLTELSCQPLWDFTYQFELPTGTCNPYCLMVLETNLDAEEPWRIEYGCSLGTAYRVLVTDGCQPAITYIGRVDDVSKWDPLFTDAFTYELAYRIAYPLTRNTSLMEWLKKEKEERWQKAKSRDGQEGRALKRFLSSSLTKVR